MLRMKTGEIEEEMGEENQSDLCTANPKPCVTIINKNVMLGKWKAALSGS